MLRPKIYHSNNGSVFGIKTACLNVIDFICIAKVVFEVKIFKGVSISHVIYTRFYVDALGLIILRVTVTIPSVSMSARSVFYGLIAVLGP